MIIALTGGSGSGKSIVAKAGEDLGFKVIDADKIGHEIILKGKPAFDEIVEYFGEAVLGEDGEIDRKKLGNIVFSDKVKLEALNNITHGKITKEIFGKISGNTIIDGAVLHSTPIYDVCDIIIAVSCDKRKRLANICSRDGITKEMAEKRIQSQMSNEDYRKLADIIITNDGDKIEFYKKAKKVLEGVLG